MKHQNPIATWATAVSPIEPRGGALSRRPTAESGEMAVGGAEQQVVLDGEGGELAPRPVATS